MKKFDASSNVVLIGMPGAGKTSVGRLLARWSGYGFVDTDHLIESAQGRSLQEIVDREGYLELRRIEQGEILNLQCRRHIISTGGSAVYSEAAMEHLGAGAVIVFLDVPLSTLEGRISNYATRGLAKDPRQEFTDMFVERLALYKKYADLTVQGSERSLRQTAAQVFRRVSSLLGPSGSR